MTADVRALKREISQLRNENEGLRGRLSVATKASGRRWLFKWPSYGNHFMVAAVRTIGAMNYEAVLTVEDDKHLVLHSVRRGPA